jgi:hypothetical protein
MTWEEIIPDKNIYKSTNELGTFGHMLSRERQERIRLAKKVNDMAEIIRKVKNGNVKKESK